MRKGCAVLRRGASQAQELELVGRQDCPVGCFSGELAGASVLGRSMVLALLGGFLLLDARYSLLLSFEIGEKRLRNCGLTLLSSVLPLQIRSFDLSAPRDAALLRIETQFLPVFAKPRARLLAPLSCARMKTH